eukprot:gene10942-2180_t
MAAPAPLSREKGGRAPNRSGALLRNFSAGVVALNPKSGGVDAAVALDPSRRYAGRS